MNVPLMPDAELLVLDALRHYMPETAFVSEKVFHSAPEDWANIMPLIVISWKGGAPTPRPERIQVTDIEVKAFHIETAQASTLMRQVKQALQRACIEHFTNRGLPEVDEPGVLSHVLEISPSGREFDGLTAKHPDSAMYATTFRITSAPTLP